MVAGALKLALLAEGAGEWASPAGRAWIATAPGDAIDPAFLGPGHVLIQRIGALERGIPEPAIQFVRPLKRGPRDARGSDLVDPSALRQLLAWPAATRAPHGTIVLFDADGDPNRTKPLESIGGIHPRVFLLAIQEFESWLLADHSALQSVLDATFDMTPTPDDMEPGEAKRKVEALRAEHRPLETPANLRLRLASQLSLEAASRRSVSFKIARQKVGDFLSGL